MNKLLIWLMLLAIGMNSSAFAENETPFTFNVYKLMYKSNDVCNYNINMKWYGGCPAFEKVCMQFFFGEVKKQPMDEYLKQFYNSFDKTDVFNTNKYSNLVRYNIILKSCKFGQYQSYYLDKKSVKDGWTTQDVRCVIYDVKRDSILTIDDVLVPEYASMAKRNAGDKIIHMLLTDKSFIWGVGVGDKMETQEINLLTNANIFTQRIHDMTNLDSRIKAYEAETKAETARKFASDKKK